ncbi:dynein light chain Tctex-type 1-like [Eucyclogobius newberryi]|uniref:dynein light chain Tctex-type 1-like n=1 Tax=Eucyclogobius newberryi TaxID=166745 RepID=UPI003B5BEEB1
MTGTEDSQTSYEGSFGVKEAEAIVKESIDATIGGEDYNKDLVNKWTSVILERCLSDLCKLGKQHKYIVTCAVTQKTGAGLHAANSCFWDTALDGSCTVKWENRTMYCIISVFALSVA